MDARACFAIPLQDIFVIRLFFLRRLCALVVPSTKFTPRISPRRRLPVLLPLPENHDPASPRPPNVLSIDHAHTCPIHDPPSRARSSPHAYTLSRPLACFPSSVIPGSLWNRGFRASGLLFLACLPSHVPVSSRRALLLASPSLPSCSRDPPGRVQGSRSSFSPSALSYQRRSPPRTARTRARKVPYALELAIDAHLD